MSFATVSSVILMELESRAMGRQRTATGLVASAARPLDQLNRHAVVMVLARAARVRQQAAIGPVAPGARPLGQLDLTPGLVQG